MAYQQEIAAGEPPLQGLEHVQHIALQPLIRGTAEPYHAALIPAVQHFPEKPGQHLRLCQQRRKGILKGADSDDDIDYGIIIMKGENGLLHIRRHDDEVPRCQRLPTAVLCVKEAFPVQYAGYLDEFQMMPEGRTVSGIQEDVHVRSLHDIAFRQLLLHIRGRGFRHLDTPRMPCWYISLNSCQVWYLYLSASYQQGAAWNRILYCCSAGLNA